MRMTPNIPNASNEKNKNMEEKRTPPQEAAPEKIEKKQLEKFTHFFSIPSFFWILFILIVFIILMISFYYGNMMRYNGGSYYYWPRMMSHMNPWWFTPQNMNKEIDAYWMDFDRDMAHMRDRQEQLWREIEQKWTITNMVGKYSGTRSMNGTTLTYSLDIGEKWISGSFSGTDTESINALVKKIEWLGYKVEKNNEGYIFSGEKWKTNELLYIFGR